MVTTGNIRLFLFKTRHNWTYLVLMVIIGHNWLNTSLAVPGALAHRLQLRTAFKIQNGRQGAPKRPTGSGKGSNQTSESTIFFLANGIGSGRRPDSAAGLSRKFNHSLSRMTKSWRKSEWNIKQIGIWRKLLKWLNKIEKDEDLDGF